MKVSQGKPPELPSTSGRPEMTRDDSGTRAHAVAEIPAPRRRRIGLLEPLARRYLRAAWDSAEARLESYRGGKLLLLAVSTLMIRLRYGQRCEVALSDGVWEYRWPDVVVMSDRPLIVRARPEEFGQLAGMRLSDDYLWDYALRPGDTVVDVGAGIGEELYEFVRLVGPTGRVYAVEAHPGSCALIERACAANGWENVTVVHAAITDRDGSATITNDRWSATNDIFRPSSMRVRACSLDSLVGALDIDCIDYLKMNIEGAETLALAGTEHAATLIRHAAISCHDFLGPERETKAHVRNSLERLDFTVLEHPNPPTVTVESLLYARR